VSELGGLSEPPSLWTFVSLWRSRTIWVDSLGRLASTLQLAIGPQLDGRRSRLMVALLAELWPSGLAAVSLTHNRHTDRLAFDRATLGGGRAAQLG